MTEFNTFSVKLMIKLGGQVLRWFIHRVHISQFHTFCVELRYDWNSSNKVRLTCLDLPYPRLGFYTLCYEMLKLDVWSMKYDVWCMKNVEWSMEYEVWSLKSPTMHATWNSWKLTFQLWSCSNGVIRVLCWTNQGTWGFNQSRCCDFEFRILKMSPNLCVWRFVSKGL